MRRLFDAVVFLCIGAMIAAPLIAVLAQSGTDAIPAQRYTGDDGTVIELRVIATAPGASPTPSPESTPTDTLTPAPPITSTPLPSPTYTPVEPSPTPEEVTTCQLIAQFNINIRPAPTTTNQPVGVWLTNSLTVIDEFRADANYVWAHHLYAGTGEFITGWSVVAVVGDPITWWVYNAETGPLCGGVAGWGDWPYPPMKPSLVAIAVHSILWTNRARIMEFQTALAAYSLPGGTKNYLSENLCRDSLAAGYLCIERWPPDCPPNIGTADPKESATAYMEARNGGVQALRAQYGNTPLLITETVNECLMDGHAAWWNTWIITAVDYAADHQWGAVAYYGFGPGNPGYEFLRDTAEATQYIYDHGGYISLHNYEPVEQCKGDGSLTHGSIWCAYRHRLTYYWLHDLLGVDVRMLITELAPGSGNTQVTQAVINDFGSYYCKVKNDPGLYAISPWLFGYHPSWPLANLEGWGSELARSFATCSKTT